MNESIEQQDGIIVSAASFSSQEITSSTRPYLTDMTPRAATPLTSLHWGSKELLGKIVLDARSSAAPERLGCIVGEIGVGKSTLITNLAQMAIASPDCPEYFKNSQLIKFDAEVFVNWMNAGKNSLDFNEQLGMILDEVMQSDAMVYIDKAHYLFTARDHNKRIELKGIMMRALHSGRLKCMLETSISGYDALIRSCDGMSVFIKQYWLCPPNTNYMVPMLEDLVKRSERFSAIKFHEGALYVIAKIGAKHVVARQANPKCSLSVLDLVYDQAEKDGLKYITKEYVSAVMTKLCHVREGYLSNCYFWESVKDLFQTKMLGNSEAVQEVNEAIAMGSYRHPLGNQTMSFFILGPEGSGKTYFAQLLHQTYINETDGESLTFDCDLYQDLSKVHQLIDSVFESRTHLDELRTLSSLKTRPFQVVLFEKFEKMHIDGQLLIQQALYRGAFVNMTGDEFEILNTIFVFTSNQHAEAMAKKPGHFNMEFWAAEFFERQILGNLFHTVARIVVLDDLCRDRISELVKMKVAEVELFRKLRISPSDDFMSALAERVYAADRGGHDIEKALEEELHDTILHLILGGRLATRLA